MGNFQRLLAKHGGNWGDFNGWCDRCERDGGRGKRLLDAYQASLRRCEIFESDLQTWIMRHIEDGDFEARLRDKGKRLADLEALSVASLEAVFAAYRKDRTTHRAGGL
jgi:hypothetical protein